MSKKMLFTTFLVSLSLIGCTNTEDSAVDDKSELNQLTEEVTELEAVVAAQEEKINSLENFSYLNDFTEAELGACDRFLEDHDIAHLKDYSPEKIVLLYSHSLATGDIDTIHAITYDGGTLADLETFSEQLNAINSNTNTHDVVMTYRNYDSIEVREEHKTEDSVGVEMRASTDIHTSEIIYEVKKENDQWKMVIQHLF